MTTPLDEKTRILEAVLPHVMFDGWSDVAIAHAVKDLGVDSFHFDRYFPGGAKDLISFFVSQADDKMEEDLIRRDVATLKIRERITLAVRLRLEMYAPHKDAIRKALTLMSLPQNMALGLKLTEATVSRMWYATGDKSTDFSYYTKRLTLGVVYSATLLYWLNDGSEGHEKTWEFLDRRIENVMQFETAKFKMRKKLSEKPKMDFIPSPKRFFQNLKAR